MTAVGLGSFRRSGGIQSDRPTTVRDEEPAIVVFMRLILRAT